MARILIIRCDNAPCTETLDAASQYYTWYKLTTPEWTKDHNKININYGREYEFCSTLCLELFIHNFEPVRAAPNA